MRRVELTGTGLSVSPICLGTADFGTKITEDAVLALFDRYVEAGGNYLDSAHCYAGWVKQVGISDRITGVLARHVGRENVVIATKGGHVGYDGYPRPDQFCTPELIDRDLRESLDRMQLDSVDLFYLHRDDPRTPAGELLEAAAQHVLAGRTRAIGASNWTLKRLQEANAYADAHGLPRFRVLQNQWSLAAPNWTYSEAPGAVHTMTRSWLPDLEAMGMSVCPWSSNANGFFATRGERGASTYDSETARGRLARCEELAAERGGTPGQFALSYLMHASPRVVPIIGATRMESLEEALGATRLELAEADRAYLEG